MQDVQLYQQLLGLELPWKVSQVEMEHSSKSVVVRVEFKEKTQWGCPQCHQKAHVHQWETRRWRHLDTCQYQTVIEAKVPRVKCPEHGSVSVSVPWAERYGRFTKLFERFAIDVLQECSTKGACKILGISWDEADGIKQRAVKRGLLRKKPKVMARLCVDEKSYGHGHQYATIVAEVQPGQPVRVEFIQQGRSQESLDEFWQGLNDEQLAGVEAVAMDLWEGYLKSTTKYLPQADQKISHDPFHLVRYMNEAVNKVRIKESQEAMKSGGGSILKGTRYAWLYGFENLKERYHSIIRDLPKLNLKTARAWHLKETFRWFWWLENRQQAEEFFRSWYSWAIRCQLDPVKRVASMFKRHLQRILNYFDSRLTNGPIEGLNNRIQSLKKKAFGHRSFDRFKADVLFHLGGLDLYPQ